MVGTGVSTEPKVWQQSTKVPSLVSQPSLKYCKIGFSSARLFLNLHNLNYILRQQ